MAVALLVLTSGGCSTLIDRVAQPKTIVGKAFLFGGCITGVPVAAACLPLTLPLCAANRGDDLLFALIAPGVPTFVAGGLAVAAPVAVLDLLIGAPLRFLRRRVEPDPEAAHAAAPPPRRQVAPPPRPRRRRVNRPRRRAPWPRKAPPRLRLRAGAGPPICEPEVQRDIERGVELEERLIPLQRPTTRHRRPRRRQPRRLR